MEETHETGIIKRKSEQNLYWIVNRSKQKKSEACQKSGFGRKKTVQGLVGGRWGSIWLRVRKATELLYHYLLPQEEVQGTEVQSLKWVVESGKKRCFRFH